MLKIRKIELLAPAKNLECGIEAINHGADAVYIGSPQFGARAAAGNTLDDIHQLTTYAHQFGAKVYVALNTILTDSELRDAEKLIWQLHHIAVDAIIVQDMGITMLNLPPIALHASTQMDTRTVEKAKFLEEAGFSQIVLARELTESGISDIAAQVQTPLEIFVHGSLCVCYSGQCYLSQAIAGRSANKGSCAQYCRLPYKLVDADGQEVVNKKHLLSMKDLNLSEDLEDLINAGASSLKIEGRLKDLPYVKNTVAYYRQKIDRIIEKYPQYIRSSSGHSTYTFEPNLEKSFNRGYTKYFFRERIENIWSVDSPKSIGEPIGTVADVTTKHIKIRSSKKINNGDGLCFFNHKKELDGVHVNRVDGDLLYVLNIPEIKTGTQLYRNFDSEFEKILSKKTAERKINANITFSEIDSGYSLQVTDEDSNTATLEFEYKKEIAQKDQLDNLKRNLSKTGNTIFEIVNVEINWNNNLFVPASVVSEWRRLLVDQLLLVRKTNSMTEVIPFEQTSHAFPTKQITYLGNVMNDRSKQFYVQHQSDVIQPAFEKEAQADAPLMFTRHCIKYSLNWCPKHGGTKPPFSEPFYLMYNNTKLRLEFDCEKCEMEVYQCSK